MSINVTENYPNMDKSDDDTDIPDAGPPNEEQDLDEKYDHAYSICPMSLTRLVL